jgi:hypothetical protein
MQVDRFFNYKKIIKYNKKKKFFCIHEIKINRIKCLGASKGRIYSPMDEKSRIYLNEFYKNANKIFLKLLNKYKYHVPNWLKKQINSKIS